MTESLREYDTARYLDTPERIAAFVNDALADNDQSYLEHALKLAARAREMHGLDAGQSTGGPAPERDQSAFDVVRRTLAALGMKLQVAAA